MRKRLLLGFVLLLFTGILTQFRLVHISDSDMAPGLKPGDWVLLGPGAASPGAVVQLNDPNDPSRKILRRIVGQEGDRIIYQAGNLSLNDRNLRIREMERKDGWVVRSEADAWLLRKKAGVDRSRPVDQEVQERSVFLFADARDEAIDSRWWGDIPQKQIGRKIWLRWGKADTWRERWNIGSQDGPWPVPKPKAPSKDAISTTRPR